MFAVPAARLTAARLVMSCVVAQTKPTGGLGTRINLVIEKLEKFNQYLCR